MMMFELVNSMSLKFRKESLEEVHLHSRTSVSELKDGSLLVKAQCRLDSRALSKLCSVAIDLSLLLPIISLTVVKAQYFVENFLVCHPNIWLKNYVPNMSRKCIVFAIRLMGLIINFMFFDCRY